MEENNDLNLENMEENADNNGIKISDDVIATIAGMEVSKVAGVAEMSGGFAGGISEVLSGKKSLSKGIKVERNEKSIKIDVNIIVEYGTRIPDIAFEIQNRVKTEVEEKTGIKVEDVNVNIQGIKTYSNDQDINPEDDNKTE